MASPLNYTDLLNAIIEAKEAKSTVILDPSEFGKIIDRIIELEDENIRLRKFIHDLNHFLHIENQKLGQED